MVVLGEGEGYGGAGGGGGAEGENGGFGEGETFEDVPVVGAAVAHAVEEAEIGLLHDGDAGGGGEAAEVVVAELVVGCAVGRGVDVELEELAGAGLEGGGDDGGAVDPLGGGVGFGDVAARLGGPVGVGVGVGGGVEARGGAGEGAPGGVPGSGRVEGGGALGEADRGRRGEEGGAAGEAGGVRGCGAAL